MCSPKKSQFKESQHINRKEFMACVQEEGVKSSSDFYPELFLGGGYNLAGALLTNRGQVVSSVCIGHFNSLSLFAVFVLVVSAV